MRHSSFLFLTAAVSLFVAAVGCSNDEGSDDSGSSSGENTGSSSGSSSGAVSQNDAGASSSSGAVSANSITVVVAGESYPVDLTTLPTTTFKELTVVTLPSVWAATGLKVEYTGYNFEFVGADGFRPNTRPNCKDVVFDGATTFGKGYITVDSRRLTWDDDLGFAPCASVSDLATIEASLP